MDIRGKTAIVTGASSGVGRATALLLAERGARLAINYRQSAEAAQTVVDKICKAGGQAIAVQADVSNDDATKLLVKRVVDHFGCVDILINNAGATEFIPFDDLEAATDEVWNALMAVNVLGPFHMIRAAIDALKQSGGEIVTVSSVAGLTATGSSIPYACSKAAVNALTVALARTLAPQVRVNAVAPGFIAGRWLEQGLGDRYAAVRSRYEARLPLRAVCQPEDIARVIVGIVEGSDLVTGQIVRCDGGMSIMDPMGLG